jgi:DMSO/TMAO reductase YedYZ molybdopterin-dependent catalytic subunit
MIGHPRRASAAAAFAALVLCWSPAHAADATAAIAIRGNVQHPEQLTVQDLEKLPQTTVQVSFATGHGQESATYAGALLWSVLAQVELVNVAGKNTRLRHAILVTGSDGYEIALSLGEIDPDFEGKSVILAVSKNGAPLDDKEGIRLIVPNDRHGGRAVHNVETIEVQ